MSKGLLSIYNVPAINENLTSDDVLNNIIPKLGLKSIFQASIGINGQIELTFIDVETNSDKTVVIPEYLYNPAKHSAMIAEIFISNINFGKKDKFVRPDYLNKNKNLILIVTNCCI